jgi:lipopolysaccharide biosynthesis regulator YciM
MGMSKKELEQFIENAVAKALAKAKPVEQEQSKPKGKAEKLELEPSIDPDAISDDELKKMVQAIDAAPTTETPSEPFECPDCHYQAKEQFNPCPKCSSKLRWA